MFYLRQVLSFFEEIYKNRRLIFDLSKRDFRERFVSSYLGILWAFIQPLVNVLVFWFVFEVGFRVRPTSSGLPYILWLITGLFPWYFFSDAIVGGTNAIMAKSFLVKKVVFPVRILPVVPIISALIINIFFIFLLYISFLLYGYFPNIYNLQIFYYSFASIFLVIGLSWITSSISVFLRDIIPLINMCLQLLFWLTPIFWDINHVPEKYRLILKLNPVAYIVDGYRLSFTSQQWFWNDLNSLLCFWIVTIILIFLGVYIFEKLRPHFADVL